MKLKRTRSRIVEGKAYFRWTIQIPPTEVVRLGWAEGDELEADTRAGVLRVRKAGKPPTRK